MAPAIQAACHAIEAGRIRLPWGFLVEFLEATGTRSKVLRRCRLGITHGDLVRLGGFPVTDLLYLSGLHARIVQDPSARAFSMGTEAAGLGDVSVLSLDLGHNGQATLAVSRAPVNERGILIDGAVRAPGSKGRLPFTEDQPALRAWGAHGASGWCLAEQLTGSAIDDSLNILGCSGQPTLGAQNALDVLEIPLAARMSPREGRVLYLDEATCQPV